MVVAVDGSAGSKEALRWAVDEAEVRGAELTAVMAWSWLDQHEEATGKHFSPGYTEDDAKATLAEAVGEVAPGRSVAQQVVCDLAVPGLLAAAEGADLLITGARGHGGFTGLRLGSISEKLMEDAACPVAVIHRYAPVRGAKVVVGVDGSEPSRVALRWAAEEARARDAELVVVHAWGLPVAAATPFDGMPDVALYESGERTLLEESMAEPALQGVRASGHLVAGGPARSVLELAEGAGLIVVGSRGRGRLAGAILGSTSRQVVHHAECPVVVLRAKG
jgi:nucleotide-binding universal stress UspA family protein